MRMGFQISRSSIPSDTIIQYHHAKPFAKLPRRSSQSHTPPPPSQTLRRVPKQQTLIPHLRELLIGIPLPDLFDRHARALGVYALQDEVVACGPDDAEDAEQGDADAETDGVAGGLGREVDV